MMIRRSFKQWTTSRYSGALATVIFLVSPALCQEAYWSQENPAVAPAPRTQAKMVYDAARGEVVLFGGYVAQDSTQPGYNSDETWVWDGATWASRSPSSRPSGRHGGAMAYDSLHREVIYLGGAANWETFGDTWVWDGSNWSQRFPAHSPSSRFFHAMAFDEVRGKVVLFGGAPMGAASGETWLWDGDDWTQVFPALSPPLRWQHSMVYDSARQSVVVFGGWGGGSGLSDSWTWDGATWHPETPATTPQLRWGQGMAFDKVRHEVVMFAGLHPAPWPADTWVWDGSNWTERVSVENPSWRTNYAMTFDAARGQVVLFGGDENNGTGYFRILNDTWVTEPSLPSLGPAVLWVGLKNSDDQGTQFDLRVELFKNSSTLLSAGETLCITGVTRNPSLAKEVGVPFGEMAAESLGSGDQLSFRVLARVGTNPDGTKCPGPGGSHNNATGLRLYFDSTSRPSRFGAETPPAPLSGFFLHFPDLFDSVASAASTPRYSDSGGVNFAGGNPWKPIGTWRMNVP